MKDKNMLCCKLDNEDTVTMMLLCDHLLDDKMLTEEFATFLKMGVQELSILGLKLKLHFNFAREKNATCTDSAHETNRS